MADTAEHRIASEIEAARALKLSLGADADDEELLAGMVEGETSLFELAGRVVDAIMQDEELVAGIAARESILKDRKARIKRRITARKAKLEQAILIFGEKMELPEATIFLRNNADKMIVTAEEEIPSQFYKRGDPVLDMKGIKDALKALTEADEPIPGVMLQASPRSIQIRKS